MRPSRTVSHVFPHPDCPPHVLFAQRGHQIRQECWAHHEVPHPTSSSLAERKACSFFKTTCCGEGVHVLCYIRVRLCSELGAGHVACDWR